MLNFLAGNWIWIGFVVAMFAMHRSGGGCGMHGGHGGHGTHRHHEEPTGVRDSDRDNEEARTSNDWSSR